MIVYLVVIWVVDDEEVDVVVFCEFGGDVGIGIGIDDWVIGFNCGFDMVEWFSVCIFYLGW